MQQNIFNPRLTTADVQRTTKFQSKSFFSLVVQPFSFGMESGNSQSLEK